MVIFHKFSFFPKQNRNPPATMAGGSVIKRDSRCRNLLRNRPDCCFRLLSPGSDYFHRIRQERLPSQRKCALQSGICITFSKYLTLLNGANSSLPNVAIKFSLPYNRFMPHRLDKFSILHNFEKVKTKKNALVNWDKKKASISAYRSFL